MKNHVVVLSLLSTVWACGDLPPHVPQMMDRSLIPMTVGHRWTYQVTESSGVIAEKTQTITGTITGLEGRPAFVFLTQRAAEKGTRSVQMNQDGVIVRLSEETLDANAVKNTFRYEPYQIRINSNLVATDDRYTTSYTKHKLGDQGQILSSEVGSHAYIVEAAQDNITVPAGTYAAVRVRRETDGRADKTYWYVPGVGKIKELGGQTEELIQVELAEP